MNEANTKKPCNGLRSGKLIHRNCKICVTTLFLKLFFCIVRRCNQTFNLAVNAFDAKRSGRYSRVLVVAELGFKWDLV